MLARCLPPLHPLETELFNPNLRDQLRVVGPKGDASNVPSTVVDNLLQNVLLSGLSRDAPIVSSHGAEDDVLSVRLFLFSGR